MGSGIWGAKAMTKSNLINRMCEACAVPTGRSEQIVNAIFNALEEALKRGERVEIRGFGSFEVRDYRGYVGRNPRTGSTVEVKAKRLAFFKVGKELKDRVQSSALRARAAADAAAPVADRGITAALAPATPTKTTSRTPLPPPHIKHAPLGASNP